MQGNPPNKRSGIGVHVRISPTAAGTMRTEQQAAMQLETAPSLHMCGGLCSTARLKQSWSRALRSCAQAWQVPQQMCASRLTVQGSQGHAKRG
jgi:hypothetical protein